MGEPFQVQIGVRGYAHCRVLDLDERRLVAGPARAFPLPSQGARGSRYLSIRSRFAPGPALRHLLQRPVSTTPFSAVSAGREPASITRRSRGRTLSAVT